MFESAGGDAGLWLSRLFGGGGGMAIGANTVPSTDFGAALGAMNPGMAGMAAVPNDAFNAAQPFTSGNSVLGGASSAGLSKALGDLGAGAKQQQAQQAAGAAKLGAPQLGTAPLGQPRSAVSLTPLIQLLAQRRNALMPGSATSGQPPGAQPTVGLLGF